jgi:hypothetical protein
MVAPKTSPRRFPRACSTITVQQLADGIGALLHRYYAVHIEGSRMAPQ